jgi:hypothetical protein
MDAPLPYLGVTIGKEESSEREQGPRFNFESLPRNAERVWLSDWIASPYIFYITYVNILINSPYQAKHHRNGTDRGRSYIQMSRSGLKEWNDLKTYGAQV